MTCSTCRPSVPCVGCIAKAQQELCHGCDGPITDFVLIMRACRLAASGKYHAEIVANALDESLREYGFLPETNLVLMTGS